MTDDLKYAVRTLSRSPGYVAVALITLALGIGANTAIFSIVRGVLLRPLPFPAADELVQVREMNARGSTMQVAWRNFEDYRTARSFEALAVFGPGGQSTVLGLGEPVRVGVSSVSRDFFRALQAQPERGRPLLPEDHVFGAPPVALVSDAFWRTHLGADPDLSKRRLNVDGFDAEVVGVMPPGFSFPEDVDIWAPMELTEQPDSRTAHNWPMLGRLGDGVTVAQADAELDAIVAGFASTEEGAAEAAAYSDYFPSQVTVQPLLSSIVDTARKPLWILLAAAGLVLLVACTNLASTALARGTHREREVAVRRALGAGRTRIARLLFIESLVLALAGGALGLALAAASIRVLPVIAPATLPRVDQIGLDPVVLGFTLAASMLTAVIFGLLPAVRGSGTRLALTLRSGGRGGSEGGREGLWSGLVAAEVAFALLLLVGAGLLIRSFDSILAVDGGFRTEDVLLVEVNPPASKYGEADEKRVLWDRLLPAMRAVPGVAAAGLGSRAPLTWISNGLVDVRGGPEPSVSGDYQVADAAYFEVLEIPLLRGRLFDDRDRPGTDHVVVVNQAFADLAWPNEDPIGKQMTGGGMDDYWTEEDSEKRWATVIGVVANVRQRDLASPPRPTYYFPYSQRPFRTWSATLVMTGAGDDPEALVPALRDAARRVDSDVPVSFRTIESAVARSVGDRRFNMLVLGIFALVALVLAGVGIYGVVSYSVARRTREMGIRLALGAKPRSVRALAQRRVLVPAAVGLAIGLAGALALGRVLASLLYEVSPTDPVTLGAVVVVLGAAAWLAGWIPARRTARIDPMTTMRSE